MWIYTYIHMYIYMHAYIYKCDRVPHSVGGGTGTLD